MALVDIFSLSHPPPAPVIPVLEPRPHILLASLLFIYLPPPQLPLLRDFSAIIFTRWEPFASGCCWEFLGLGAGGQRFAWDKFSLLLEEACEGFVGRSRGLRGLPILCSFCRASCHSVSGSQGTHSVIRLFTHPPIPRLFLDLPHKRNCTKFRESSDYNYILV